MFDGSHLAVVCGEDHLRLAVLYNEQLVLADVSVSRLDHAVPCHCRQIFAGRVPQRHAAQLSDGLHLDREQRITARLTDERAVAV